MKALLILISSFLLIGNSYAMNAEQIYKSKVNTILKMGTVNPKGEFVYGGTGFFVNHEGRTYILTNEHVISGIKREIKGNSSLRLAAESKSGKIYSNIKVFGTHKYADVGIILIDELQEGYAALSISKTEAKTGEDVFLIGHPDYQYFSITSGILSRSFEEKEYDQALKDFKKNKYGEIVWLSRLQYTANSLPGSSGSPILNKDGEVVGIHSDGKFGTVKKYDRKLKDLVDIPDVIIKEQGFNKGYSKDYFFDLENYNQEYSNIAQSEYPSGKRVAFQGSLNTEKSLSPEASKEQSNFKLLDFPFPKELNMRMAAKSDNTIFYVGDSEDGNQRIEIRYNKIPGTDAQFSSWKKVNDFVVKTNRDLKNAGKVITYPIIDSGVFHVKSTLTMKNGTKVKYLRIFPGNNMRFDLIIHSKSGDFDKINVVVEKFMDKLRGNKAFSHLYKGRRNISNI